MEETNTPSEIAVEHLTSGLQKLITDVTPCSTAPSTPTWDRNQFETGCSHKTEKSSPTTSKSGAQQLIHSLQDAYTARASPETMIAHEDALIDHLHSNAATLADTQALVPTLVHKRKVMIKLATNIGLYHARNRITDTDLEVMLVHIFTHDDYSYWLFSRTTNQIERFRNEKAERRARMKTPKQLRYEEKRKEALRKAEAEKVLRDAKYRYECVPARYRVVSDPAFLPLGCSSIADIIVEIDGLTWTQTMTVSRLSGETIAHKSFTKDKPVVPKVSNPSSNRSALKNSIWARTRLHNGPGMDDRSPAKVRMPCPETDRRLVLLSAVPDQVPGEKMLRTEAKLSAVTKPWPGHLMGNKRAEVWVKMPPC
jgi:hypothetical protein